MAPKAPTTSRASLLAGEIGQLPPSEVARTLGSEDLIDGSEFFATHQLRTPLRVLLRHGEVHRDMHTPPPAIASELWHGRWVMRLKSWRAIGVDMDELPHTCASEFGLVESHQYLPFLIAVRSIVEGDGPAVGRRDRLQRELVKPSWVAFVDKLGGCDAVLDRFFPRFVDTIKGLPREAASALHAMGLITPTALLAANDADLLAIKGIGPAKLRAIRAASVAAHAPSDELCDLVMR